MREMHLYLFTRLFSDKMSHTMTTSEEATIMYTGTWYLRHEPDIYINLRPVSQETASCHHASVQLPEPSHLL